MNSLIFLINTIIVLCVYAIEFSTRSRNFSIELLHYTQAELHGHVVISPFGIWTLLTILGLGTGGRSKAQTYRALNLPNNEISIVNGVLNISRTVLNPSTEGITLTSKNFMFIDETFSVKPAYKKKVRQFDAVIETLNFRNSKFAAEVANDRIRTSGTGLSDVLTLDDFVQSRMILANVISFKGLWQSPFNTSDTEVVPFYNENRKKIGEVNMMYQRTPALFANMPSLQSLVLELPYGNDSKYCMLVVLPYHKIKVTDVFKKFETVSFAEIFNMLQTNVDEFGLTDIDIKLPRFKISTNVLLNVPLNKMGVYDIFDESLANLKLITEENVFVSAIVHKADIEVTESGTVASGATVVDIYDRITTPMFEANRPFIYFIMEKPTATIIFGGLYSEPSVF